MKKFFLVILILFIVFFIGLLVTIGIRHGGGRQFEDRTGDPILPVSALKIVAELDEPPGNIAVSEAGRKIYIADTSTLAKEPAIIVYDTAENTARRLLEDHPSVVEQDWIINARGHKRQQEIPLFDFFHSIFKPEPNPVDKHQNFFIISDE